MLEHRLTAALRVQQSRAIKEVRWTPWRKFLAIVVVERESDFESDLVMRHLAAFDMPSRLHHLEPADLAQGARGAANGILDCVFKGFL